MNRQSIPLTRLPYQLIERAAIPAMGQRHDPEDDHHQRIEVMRLAEVIRYSQQVRPEDERGNGTGASKKTEAAQCQRHLPYALKRGEQSPGQHRHVQDLKEVYRHPEAIRDFCPGAEVLREVEKEERAEE